MGLCDSLHIRRYFDIFSTQILSSLLKFIKKLKTSEILGFIKSNIKGLFTLMSFSTLPNFGKVTKKVTTFSLLPNFGNYIRNPAKILASSQTLVRFFLAAK